MTILSCEGPCHQLGVHVELCQADVVDVAAARSALLDPLEHQVRVVVAEAFKPGFGSKDDLIITTWQFLRECTSRDMFARRADKSGSPLRTLHHS